MEALAAFLSGHAAFGLVAGILEQGLIFGIMALGVYISYKILDFPDLSVDGTFPLGAAVATRMILSGQNPWLSLLAAFFAGAAAGCLTGFFNVKLKIKDLLCGILVMTLLYSVNYRIAGAPNQFFMGADTIFSQVNGLFGSLPRALSPYMALLVAFVITLLAKYVLDWYLSTKSGFLLRSVGDNPGLVVTLAQSPGKIKVIGLAISNGLVALAGAVSCQRNVQFDISSGTGTIVMGLAAVIIGTTVFQKLKFMRITSAVLVGMVVYKACITIAISLGLQSSDMNMVITILFVLTLVLNDFFAKKRRVGNA